MSIQFRRDGEQIIVFGKTYDHRDTIKSLGGRFEGASKVWLVPFSSQNIERLESLAQGRPQASSHTALVFAEEAPIDAATGMSIAELVSKASLALSAAFPTPVWIVAEIQNITRKDSAIFLTLAEPKDSVSQVATLEVKATLWRSSLTHINNIRGEDKINDVLQDGLKARVLCQVGFYRDRAQLSLNIIDIDPAYTKGALALAREALLKELRAKGLDRKNKSLSLSLFPLKVGLISADGSRAYSDFVNQLWSYKFPGSVLFAAVATQGESVPKSVSDAIKALSLQQCDVIVITRGGGSAADLRWFDAPAIAYAIAECPIPIVAAIGHHDDISVTELISFAHEKTPTAAADFIIAAFQQTRTKIHNMSLQLAQILLRYTEHASKLHAQVKDRLKQAATLSLMQTERSLIATSSKLEVTAREGYRLGNQQLSDFATRIAQRATDLIHQQSLRLTQIFGAIQKLDPKPWLAAGWTQLSLDQQPITSINQVGRSDTLKARLLDGTLILEVKDKTLQEPKHD